MNETFQPIDLFAVVLLLAVTIGCINYFWIKLPPAIGMLLGALVVSLAIVSSDRVFHLHVMGWFRGTLDTVHLPRVFLNAVLALMLFAGSLHVDVAELNRRRWTILLLATASVMCATLIFGAGMWLAFSVIGMAVPLVWCIVLGAILAPTDAVVVESLLQQIALPQSLRAAIVGESLFNDGAGVVLFLLALGVTQGETYEFGHGQVLVALFREIGGGALLGVATGFLAALLLLRVDDDGLLLLISLTLVIGSYRLANVLDLSGPIAVVSAGLCVASPSPRFGMTPKARAVLVSFWTLLDQLMNTMLFLLVGLQILGLVIQPAELIPLAFAVPLAVIARALSVAVPLMFVHESLLDRVRDMAVLTWAGLRGGISIALALSLPASPWRGDLLVVAYAVVVFTIVVQGLTLPGFLRKAYGAKKRRPSVCEQYQKFAERFACCGAGGLPDGKSYMPAGSASRKVSTSEVFTTSAYLAFMSHRLMAWLACERSKQPSSASAMR
jgi:CPA1 family monovalent cation:H+ antiporter